MLASYASILVLLSTNTLALAHFHGTVHEHALRDANEYAIRRAYTDTCHAKLAARGYHQAGSERRALMARQIRSGLADASVAPPHDRQGDSQRRQLATVKESHLSSGNYTSASDPFNSTTSGCVLQPDVTQGPYWVEGELIRTNVTDDEPGVPLYADFQIIDVSTCEPVSGVYLDFWHANSTGVYSGVIASGNGDSSDSTNLNNVALRGLQQTDSSGVAQFISVFPGHYTGRATHIHVMVHQTDGTLQSNGTYVNSTASHVGQVFFDQDLITQVDAVEPYSSNTQTVTENSEDMILESVWDTFDPMMSYALIGDSLADGILAWSTIVINATESSNVGAAAHYYETGGVAEDSGVGGESGGGVGIGMGNGTAPSGMPGISGSPNASGSAGAIANTNGSGSTTTTRTASMGAISASASRGAAIEGRRLPAVFAWLA